MDFPVAASQQLGTFRNDFRQDDWGIRPQISCHHVISSQPATNQIATYLFSFAREAKKVLAEIT